MVATAKKYDEGAIRVTPSISVHQAKLFMDGVINAPANTGALLEPYLREYAAPRSHRNSNRRRIGNRMFIFRSPS